MMYPISVAKPDKGKNNRQHTTDAPPLALVPEYECHYWFTNKKFINQKSRYKMCLYIDRNKAPGVSRVQRLQSVKPPSPDSDYSA
ncbi:hypothetical protein NCT57_000252 [Salmonella enterica]|nr:hypothetical protein [Salmonella enterica]